RAPPPRARPRTSTATPARATRRAAATGTSRSSGSRPGVCRQRWSSPHILAVALPTCREPSRGRVVVDAKPMTTGIALAVRRRLRCLRRQRQRLLLFPDLQPDGVRLFFSRMRLLAMLLPARVRIALLKPQGDARDV